MHYVISKIHVALIQSRVFLTLAILALARSSFADSGPGAGRGTAEIVNPLRAPNIICFIQQIIDIILIFALPIIVLAIIYAGFLIVTAQGDVAKVTKGREAFTWAVVGGVLILGAKVIMVAIKGTVDAFMTNPIDGGPAC